MADKKEITDEERTVLQIKFEDGSKLFLNKMGYVAVINPYMATRYPPIDDEFPNRKISQDQDKEWMEGCYDAEVAFVPFLQACKEHKTEYEDD
jgi:hypothetical protein